MRERDIFEKLSEVSSMKMPLEKQYEIWELIEKNIDKNHSMKRGKRMSTLSSLAAAAVAVVIVGGGIGFIGHSRLRTPQSTSKVTTGSNTTKSISSDSPIKTKVYTSPAQANSQITQIQRANSYLDFTSTMFPTVNLGSGITAKQDGGLDHRGYQWKQGDWTVEVLYFSNNSGSKEMAQSIISFLNTHTLPSPKNRGIIIVNSTDSNSSTIKPKTLVAWQENNQVMQFQKSGSPTQALQVLIESGKVK